MGVWDNEAQPIYNQRKEREVRKLQKMIPTSQSKPTNPTTRTFKHVAFFTERALPTSCIDSLNCHPTIIAK